jgi:amino acid transporter
MSILVLFICASLPPVSTGTDGIAIATASTLSPLNNGFALIFDSIGGGGKGATASYALWASVLSVPATVATAFGFIFSYGRTVFSMARSNLYPPLLARTYGKYKTPYMAYLFGSVFGYILCLIAYFIPYVATLLFNQCIMAAFLAYISQCIAYINFKKQYKHQARLFYNPLGIAGAIYAGTVFALAAIGSAFYQNDGFNSLYIFLVTILLYTLYYFFYAKERQQISPEEKEIFLNQIVKCKSSHSCVEFASSMHCPHPP